MEYHVNRSAILRPSVTVNDIVDREDKPISMVRFNSNRNKSLFSLRNGPIWSI